METALQKAIFSRKEEQQYMPVLHENHIHKDTEFFMIQCYFPANKDIQADDKFDNTQFFYRFIRQCQQIFAEKKVLSVVFQRDLYITLVAKNARRHRKGKCNPTDKNIFRKLCLAKRTLHGSR